MNDAETLGQRLSTDVTETAALDFQHEAQVQVQLSSLEQRGSSWFMSTTTRSLGLRRSLRITRPP